MKHLLRAAACVALLSLTGCANEEAAEPDLPDCVGEIPVRQGSPTQLPGGGTVGIGQFYDTDPRTVRLAIGAKKVVGDPKLGVGSQITIESATYELECIDLTSVGLKQVLPPSN